MIFVTLGTQDKQFERLPKAVEQLNIDEDIIMQVGSTNFKTDKDNIKVYKYIEPDEFARYMNEASLIITHAGVGTMVQGLLLHKKMIVAARLKKYKEHVNDHQIQILETFSSSGYILPLYNFDDLEDLIKKEFVTKNFVSNNELFNNKLDNEIELLTKRKGEK